jgi:hypothetical protein
MKNNAMIPHKSFLTRHTFLAASAGMLLTLLTAGPRTQAQVPTPAPPPEINQPAAPMEILPINEDPNDPQASPEERLRRQRVLIMKRIQARTQQMQKEKEAAAKAALQATPTPTPTPPAKPHDKKDARVTIFLSPATATVAPGERFSTQCLLLNQDLKQAPASVDRIELYIAYPAQAIRLEGIHQSRLKEYLDGQPECLVNEKAGTIIYRAKLKYAVSSAELEVVTLVWKAVATVNEGEIRLSIGGKLSQALSGKRVVSDSAAGEDGALLGTLIRVEGAVGAVPEGNRFLDLEADQLMLAGFKDQRKVRPPRLWIHQPEGEELQPGRWLVVDLGVDNPSHAVFDELRLAATFDPTAVEVIDADRGNWISEGVNLLDGPFHTDWPWDQHYKNTVDQKRGIFYYRMGMNDLREQPSGTVARLFVRVKRPVQAPLFSWSWSDGGDPEEPSTGIYLFNRNLYRKVMKRYAQTGATSAHMDPTHDLGPGEEKADPKVYRF